MVLLRKAQMERDISRWMIINVIFLKTRTFAGFTDSGQRPAGSFLLEKNV